MKKFSKIVLASGIPRTLCPGLIFVLEFQLSIGIT